MCRLIISALCVTWKAYIMSTDSYIFPYLLTNDQECFCMNCFYSLMSVASIIYHAGGSLLRYWYVKESLRPKVAEVFKRRKIMVLFLGTPLILLFFHLIDGLHIYITTNDFPTLLYKACIHPELGYSLPFYKFMPFQLSLMFIYVTIIVYTNVYLFVFLK